MAEIKRRRRDPLLDEIAEYAIYLDDVSKTFSDGVPALSNINLKVKQGEFVFIVGVSGAGKSTLIKLLLRELKADSGTAYVNGYNLMTIRHGKIPKFRRTLGVVFQDFRLLKDRNVYENVAFAQRIAQKSEREIRTNVPSMLSLVGLAGKYKAKPKQLAGGEQQRVAIARALVNQPKLLLADEPTGNLDLYNTQEIMRLLETINENGTTVVVVTHNEKLVNEMKKRVVTIRQGMIVSDAENGGYFDED
jgi:cell division transport system ATP-binding protein